MEPQGSKPTARGRGRAASGAGAGEQTVPEDNRPGHHPEHEQDQPDLEDFAEKFGVSDAEAGGPTGGTGVTSGAAGGAPDSPRAAAGETKRTATSGTYEGAQMQENETTSTGAAGGTTGSGAGSGGTAGGVGGGANGGENESPSLQELRDRGMEIARDTAAWAVDSMKWAMSAMNRRKGEHSGSGGSGSDR